MVFFYKTKEHADGFEHLLKRDELFYERFDEDEEGKIYFGAKQTDSRRLIELNYLIIGKYRKRFIPNKILRLTVLLASFLLLLIAVIGAILVNS